MMDNEIKSLCQQLSYTYAANKQAEVPCHLMLLGASGELKKAIDKQVLPLDACTRCACWLG
jgi:hypothetical protein